METLLVFHRELNAHRLAIISSLPECLDVSQYHIMLPEIDPETGDVIEIPFGRPRKPDWAESEEIAAQFGEVNLAASLYEGG